MIAYNRAIHILNTRRITSEKVSQHEDTRTVSRWSDKAQKLRQDFVHTEN